MNRLRRLLDARLLLAVLALALVAGIYLASVSKTEAVVIAGPSICVYYSDARFRTVVGARGTGCCGEPISWGVTTRYVRCERLLCPDVECPF